MIIVPEVTVSIARPITDVFALITDLQAYPRWLGGSSLYTGTAKISENPAKLGTRYTDKGKLTIMTGSVTTFEPPQRITFTQNQNLIVGILRIDIQYRLEEAPKGQTHVHRVVEVRGTGFVRLAEPLFPRMLRPEEARVLQAMKTYLEAE